MSGAHGSTQCWLLNTGLPLTEVLLTVLPIAGVLNTGLPLTEVLLTVLPIAGLLITGLPIAGLPLTEALNTGLLSTADAAKCQACPCPGLTMSFNASALADP